MFGNRAYNLDAAPSIFSWSIKNKLDTKMDMLNSPEDSNTITNIESPMFSRKISDAENMEAIKRYIENQEKEIQEFENQINKIKANKDKQMIDKEIKVEFNNDDIKPSKSTMDVIQQGEKVVIATSMIDMILKENKGKKATDFKTKSLSSREKGILALTVGTKVEVKDFSESWYPSNIIEVDYEEMEVLVHYENIANKHDEWISVNSPRLRPFKEISTQNPPIVTEMDCKEDKQYDKSKSLYVVGERCLARWRDNRRFIATVCSDFGDGNYEVMFDDGAKWKCPISRMYKLKETNTELTVDTSMSPKPSTPSPTLIEPGPSSDSNLITVPSVPFHKHLFDPTRDYLGSKSERRAMKRKLNIKEIFNIGQKKQKIKPPVEKLKVEKEKKLKTNRKKIESKNEDVIKVEVKADIPDAVASIIGTVDSLTNKDEKKLLEKGQEIEQAEVLRKIIEELPAEIKKEYPQDIKEVNLQEIKGVNSKDKNSEVEIPDEIKEECLLDIKENILEEIKEYPEGTKKSTADKNVEENIEKFEEKNVEEDIKAHEENVEEKIEKIHDENVEENIKKSQEANVEENIEKNQDENVEDIKDAMSVETDNTEEYEEVRVDPNQELIEESMDSTVDTDVVNSTVDTDLVAPSDLGFEEPVIDRIEEESKLENFEKPDDSKQEVLDKMQEVINKLEDGLNVESPKPELIVKLEKLNLQKDRKVEKPKKLKKKKLRLLQAKKVQNQVDKVKSELEVMKKHVEEMRKQMLLKTEEFSLAKPFEMPESFLLPGEWCCKWVNGQPVGTISEIEVDKDGKGGLPKRCVQVEDKRLPPGWTKHIVRRSLGQSAGKWDVVLIAPDKRRIHTKTDMKNYLDHLKDDSLKPYEAALTDFGIHLKLSRRMGWCQIDNDKTSLSHSKISSSTKNKKLSRRNSKGVVKRRKKAKLLNANRNGDEMPGTSGPLLDTEPLEDGYVYVGSLKVQIIDTLLRCPAEGCLKNFRNNTLIQMHIKHYHRELRKQLGATPKVLDLARERTKPTDLEPKLNRYEPESKILKVKISRPPKKTVTEEPKPEIKETVPDVVVEPKPILERIPRSQDSPKLRQVLAGNKPVKRPKVLLPVRRPEPEPEPEEVEPMDFDDMVLDSELPMEPLDFEAEISTHTVTKPFDDYRRREKKCVSTVSKRPMSEEDEWFGDDDVDTHSSFPGSGTPDSKTTDKPIGPPVSSESNEEPKEANMYMVTETGERVKIERMRREEIISCHCGFREEDGLMVQCELCLCWQHALCHNIQRESEVPDKYTCGICLNPRRGRRSKRFLHDQDRLYEGLLPGAKACESLRRSHDLSGNLLLLQDTLHALRVKYYVATKKNHPKLYLWATEWENTELNNTQERQNTGYSDFNTIVNNIGKENLPMRAEVREPHLDIRTPITEDVDDRYAHREGLLLGLSPGLASPSAVSLELPITTSELERLAKSVQEQVEVRTVSAPQPEAAIENSVCRERLLRHVQRCQSLIDARLDSMEAQVAELESQDPLFEDDETADYCPRTKQTVQMLMRDLDTMEELGIIT